MLCSINPGHRPYKCRGHQLQVTQGSRPQAAQAALAQRAGSACSACCRPSPRCPRLGSGTPVSAFCSWHIASHTHGRGRHMSGQYEKAEKRMSTRIDRGEIQGRKGGRKEAWTHRRRGGWLERRVDGQAGEWQAKDGGPESEDRARRRTEGHPCHTVPPPASSLLRPSAGASPCC